MKPTTESTFPKLELIDPKRNDKYSPNLYAWIKKRHCRPGTPQAYRMLNENYRPGLYLAFTYSDGSRCGARLGEILCRGNKVPIYELGRLSMELLPDFWERYVAIGRCAIDTEHRQSFLNDDGRWLVEGNRRSCQWCGNCVQELREREVVTVVREWHTLAEAVPQ